MISSTHLDLYYLIERISGSELGNSLMQCGKIQYDERRHRDRQIDARSKLTKINANTDVALGGRCPNGSACGCADAEAGTV
jgi:hypothetical protein